MKIGIRDAYGVLSTFLQHQKNVKNTKIFFPRDEDVEIAWRVNRKRYNPLNSSFFFLFSSVSLSPFIIGWQYFSGQVCFQSDFCTWFVCVIFTVRKQFGNIESWYIFILYIFTRIFPFVKEYNCLFMFQDHFYRVKYIYRKPLRQIQNTRYRKPATVFKPNIRRLIVTTISEFGSIKTIYYG